MYLHTLSLHDALPISYVAIRSGFGARLAEAAMRAAGERLDELDVLPTQAFRIDAETIALLIDRGNSEAVTRVDLKRLAAEVIQRLTHPVVVDGQRFLLATSAGGALYPDDARDRDEYVNKSEEHTSELPSLIRISYADFCS